MYIFKLEQMTAGSIIIYLFIFQSVLHLGWTVSLLTIVGSIFANYPFQQLGHQQSLFYGLYTAIPRVVWPMALSFIVFACHFGYGGPVNWILSLSLWQPFSRLTYAMYLTHYLVIMYVMGQSRTAIFFSDLNTVRIEYFE